MDTSKEFILMCEKAVEIQEGWIPSYHDVIFNGTVGHYKMSRKSSSVFLPRQDQLQDMVDTELADKIQSFYFFCLNVSRFDERYMELISLDGDARRLNNKSMEQLWLAFVMSEKYNKTWNGSEWKEDK